jgi:hypothetical protein
MAFGQRYGFYHNLLCAQEFYEVHPAEDSRILTLAATRHTQVDTLDLEDHALDLMRRERGMEDLRECLH